MWTERFPHFWETGPDEISSWILSHFHISRFEASELIPRAIRGVAPKLFDGSLLAQSSDIVLAWRFIKSLVESSRFTFSDEFWATIGRMPVYSDSARFSGSPPSGPLIPCSSAYWPDELLPSSSSITGTESLRRIRPEFLLQLSDGQDAEPWRDFLTRAGIGDRPKLLNYARLAVGGDELIAQKNKSEILQQFNGERQHDINLVIAQAVSNDQAWTGYIGAIPECNHGVPRVVQALAMIEGLSDCCALAQKEFHGNDPRWKDRLLHLVSHFQVNIESTDTMYCRGGRQGGHTIPVPSFVARQLAELSWLPSTAGPASIKDTFLRRPSHKLISDTRGGENVNDWLLPSVVIDDPELFLRLQRYGLAVLEDSTANTNTLIRALKEIGFRLSQEENSAWVFESPARWRAIRGAIQNVYRILNQHDDIDSQIQTVAICNSVNETVSHLSHCHFIFAEPGPYFEMHSCGILPLIDSDRVYAGLFDAIGIVQLTPGSSVREEVVYKGLAAPNATLRIEVSEGLAPYLTALARAKSDSQSDGQLTRRILAERFSVLSVGELRVRFSLTTDGNSQPVSSPPLPFYLQRRVVERSGAISEAHYRLFVSSLPDAGLFNIDADALGSTLVPMFQDRPTADLTAMFARATVRYKDLKGDREAMKEFMYTHLGVSSEIMEAIEDEQSGELSVSNQEMPPPPARIVGSPEMSEDATLAQIIESKQHEIKDSAVDAVDRVVRSARDARMQSGSGPAGGLEQVTPEQQARGLAGEEEIGRRLRRSCGWEEMFFHRDTRNEACGYDYEVTRGGRLVRLEVKTFSANGRVIVTNREMQAAAVYKADYYLIGVQHSDDIPASQWVTYMTPDPIFRLMSLGTFVVEAKLQVTASSLFDFQHDGSKATTVDLASAEIP